MSIVDFLFNQTLTTISSSVPNGYGDRTLTTKYSNVPCRFQLKTGKLITRKQEEKQYKAEVYLSPDYSISEEDRIVYGSETYVVVGVENRTNFEGEVDHIQLYLE